MTQRNSLPWRFQTLRGLHSNKTTWHKDRDGFLEYLNVDNLGEFMRLRRGGSSTITTYLYAAPASYTNKIPKTAMDFNWVNTSDPADTFNVRYLMLAGQYSLFTVDSTPTITELTMPTYSGGSAVIYPARPSMTIIKDRLFVCTSARASWQNGTWTVTVGNAMIANSGAWSGDLKHGDIIYINGGRYVMDYIDASDTTKLYLTTPYAGHITVSTKNACATRIGNLLIYDPMENRSGANKISLAGAVAPPDGMLYTLYQYYHVNAADAWVWTGHSTVANTYCWLQTGHDEVSFWSDAIHATPVPIPPAVAVDDYFYIDGTEYKITATGTTGATENIIYIEKIGAQEGTKYYDGITETIGLQADDNEIDDSTHRWAIFYGELTSNVQYAMAYCYYNSKSGHLSNPSPLTYFTTPYRKFNIKITQWNDLSDNDPNLSQHYDAVIFFRSPDGATILKETKRISSTTVPGPAAYVVDNLTTLGSLLAPLALSNSPPPSFMMIEEYQGRLWGIGNHERNKLFYSADEAQINAIDEWGMGNGRAEECWVPTNYLTIPPIGGNATSLKKCGDYLYVGTDNGLFVVTGFNESSYSMERIFSQDGVVQQCIVEYSGPLTKGVPGAFFLTTGFRAYIIAPGFGRIEVGYSVLDKLQLFSDYSEVNVQHVISAKRSITATTIGSMSYKSLKPRNYIAVTGFTSGTPRTHISLIYDIDLSEWYEHQHLYPTGGVNQVAAQSCIMCPTNIFGYPITVGSIVTFSAPNYSLNLVGLYNDNAYQDISTAYSASMKSSFNDFDDAVGRSKFKTLNRVRIFTPSSGSFLLDYFVDENPTAVKTGMTFIQQPGPFQEANNKEKAALVQSDSAAQVGPGWLYGHALSFKITFPNAGVAEQIEYLEPEYQVLGEKE